MNFTVVGAGYVGLSLALLISQKYRVSLFDLNEKKISLINSKISPIRDPDIEDFLSNKIKDLYENFSNRIFGFHRNIDL